MKTVLKLSLMTSLFALVCGVVFGQELNNPNKLPACPKIDDSATYDVGAGGRTRKWTNCWGRYKVELAATYKGDVLEGEWRNGWLNGQGTYYSLADTQLKGGKYVGEFKDGNYHGRGTYTSANGSKYVGEYKDNNYHGHGTMTLATGDKYVGDWKSGKMHGLGTLIQSGNKYLGEFKDGKTHGQGIYTSVGGRRTEGIWENDNFIREAKVSLPALINNVTAEGDRIDIDRERQQLAEERRRLEEEKRQREQQRQNERINLQVTHTQPANDGSLTINIQTNADTASLKINGEEQGGRANGDYLIKKVARAGQETKFTIVATDINGNKDTKTIAVSRAVVESKAVFAALNPANIKKQVERDAVAVVIGIANYKSLPKADFANDDARAFYDYAIRALGIKPENIKLLVDGDAEEAEILKTFRTWLPSRVKSTTEVFVFYSGHGLPMPDGKGLYLVPPRADREVIDDTAIPFSKLNAAIILAKPKSVTIFLDSCYSGQARSGETLVANARPVQLKSDSRYFPENFTVITASQNDQISSSNPELQHGIFSYYLMKGMEGDADANKDGKITLGEMQTYLTENVSRHAAMMSRKQEPQLIGDANRVLVGK